MNWQELITFIFVFIAISLLGFIAVRWRRHHLVSGRR
jgi:hypothetical protein